MPSEYKYCVSCGEQVPSNRIEREGRVELTCSYCGFVLDIKKEAPAFNARCIFTVDDSPFIRDLIGGLAVKKGLASTVVSAENGQDFVSSFSKKVSEGQPIDVVILDLEMPVMNGITAARVMRSIEEKYEARKTPIIFFSSRKCDEALKTQLGIFAPATYLNKGSSQDPTELVDRIDRLISYLLHRGRGA